MTTKARRHQGTAGGWWFVAWGGVSLRGGSTWGGSFIRRREDSKERQAGGRGCGRDWWGGRGLVVGGVLEADSGLEEGEEGEDGGEGEVADGLRVGVVEESGRGGGG